MEIILELVNSEIPESIKRKNLLKSIMLLMALCVLCINVHSQIPAYTGIEKQEKSAKVLPIAEGPACVMNETANDNLKANFIDFSKINRVIPENNDISMKDKVLPVVSENAIQNKHSVEKADIEKVETEKVETSNVEEDKTDIITEKDVNLKVIVYGNGGIPETIEISSLREEFSVTDIDVPKRPGKVFDGWYVDAACTKPFTKIDETCETLELYAGWTEFPGFISNDSGYITGYTDKNLILRDGFLVLPCHESCLGVEKHAFDELKDEIFEIYITPNIRYIAPGAFDELDQLFFIEAAPDNEMFYSEDGILYHRNGTIAVYPKGRE